MLGKNAWDIDGDTMLQLCSEEANACFITGDLATMKMLIGDILRQDISIEDKFRAYDVKTLSLNAENNWKEAIDTIIEVRKELGLSTPANKPASVLTIDYWTRVYQS